MNRLLPLAACTALAGAALGQITKPADAPKPLPPAESAKRVQLPDGFRLELVAAEPLIRQPSGVCWDAHGNLFVSELHGYNIEGQFDIESLNKTGKLDRVVRRIAANEEAMRRAEKEQFGTVKRLIDDDGDGVMDRAEVWADRLPVCLGVCPALGGIIAVCAPDILFLADRDGDGKAEIRETLFTGFKFGVIERRINSPLWGPDNWIYIDGGQGGRITGPRLAAPVDIPVSGFRIKPDGSAIEPVSGHTGTYGFTFNADGDRFVISTGTPGIQVAPLPWRYLSRNADTAVRASRRNAADYNTTFPVSQPHPWRTKRADDPGFGKYYRDRYGSAESIPNGYFTSACSPLVYQDSALPGLSGQLLACAPAQNLVHRAELQRDGVRLNIRRPAGTGNSEFLASTDIWFHPIHLAIGPEGAVYIADFYREIIEDYSAIPRYLQQLYGLDDGRDHGRVWRLVHDIMPEPQSPNLAKLDNAALAREVDSPRFWRRQTARRLLLERGAQQTKIALSPDDTSAAVNALYTLDGLARLGNDRLAAALGHAEPGVRRHALRLTERRFGESKQLLAGALRLADDASPIVRLQLALSLGESDDARSLRTLADLAKRHGGDMWVDGAILSSLGNRAGAMLEALLSDTPGALGQARGLVRRLCSAVASRKNREEFSGVIALLGGLDDPGLQLECLKGLRESFKSATTIVIDDAPRDALMRLASSGEGEVRVAALDLTRVLKLETASERAARLAKALREVADVQLPADRRLAAVRGLASENDAVIAAGLLDAYPAATPPVRRAILETAFARADHLPAVVAAMEQAKLPPSALNAVQRTALIGQKNAGLAKRARALLAAIKPVDDATLQRFVTALKAKRDTNAGQATFNQHCATCHRAHGIGFAVGPDLTAEFRRAEETIVRDILAPSAVIVAGHETYTVETTDGRVLSGLLAGESAASLTLAMAGGVRLDVLRKEIRSLKSLDVSLMPESLAVALQPSDVANVIAWLRQPPMRRVLFDDSPAFVDRLTEGSGTATVVTDDRHSGSASLRVTPLQRHSSRIPGWAFRIRENPGPGEYRYLRLAWKAPKADGVMVELADNGAWPSSGSPERRYYSGENSSDWQATRVSEQRPTEWTVVTRDLWKDFGDLTLTGIAPTALGGPVWFDRIELLRSPEE
ncbi:MAG: c-type cytochrome [Verrucomicrobia bacterium]|nr:c-type cytochrome [Verrucomicrobiota bacterium]